MRMRAPGLPFLPALLACAVLAACDAGDDGAPDAAGDVLPGDVLPGDDATPEARGGGGTFPEGATEAQILALEEVNRHRIASGLAPVDEDEALNRAAQAHASFIVSNCANYGRTGLSPHEEDASWPGFTGEDLGDRATAAGFKPDGFGGGLGEVIAFHDAPARAVPGWIRTLYHRLPLLDPQTRRIGYGGDTSGALCLLSQYSNADVIDTFLAPWQDDAVVLYPPDGGRRIPTSFDGLESPEPVRPPKAQPWPSGTIITVQFGHPLAFSVTGHRLLRAGTTDVPHLVVASVGDEAAGVVRDPNLDDPRTLALYAHDRLAAGTDYTVVLDLVRNGAPLHLEWSFKTDYKQD